MVNQRSPIGPHSSADDFQRAVKEAEVRAEDDGRPWLEMSPAERIGAIYAQLRRIDKDRAAAMSFTRGRSRRLHVEGKPPKPAG